MIGFIIAGIFFALTLAIVLVRLAILIILNLILVLKTIISYTLEKIREKFARSVENLCRIPEIQAGAGGQNQQLCQKVREYIQENFTNPDLNISQTGLYFHMTPAYLSSIYKKDTGESLLKFINQTRIDEAEKLLADGISVVEVAERVGFRDSSTFIRIFKKFTGATPGQLKSGR